MESRVDPGQEPLWAEVAQGEPDEQAREHFLALSALYDCWRTTVEERMRLAAALQACRLLDPRYLGSPARPHRRAARVKRELTPVAAAVEAPHCGLHAGSRAKRRCSVCRAMVHPSAWPEHAEYCFHVCTP